MKTVARLLPDPRLRSVNHIGGDLFSAMCREAVEEDRVGFGVAHQLCGHHEAFERRSALLGLVFLSHRRPHIGVYSIGVGDRGEWIGQLLENDRFCVDFGDDVRRDLVAGRRGT